MRHVVRLGALCAYLRERGSFPKDETAERLWAVVTEQPWKVLLLGPYNAGKTTLLNALLGQERFTEGPTPETTSLQSAEIARGLVVIDSPGLDDPQRPDDEHITKLLAAADPPALVLLVMTPSQFERMEQGAWRWLARARGRSVCVVLNERSRMEAEARAQLEERARVRLETMQLGVRVMGVFAVNADSAKRAALEGRAELRAASGIGALETALFEAHRQFRSVERPEERLLRLLATTLRRAAEGGELEAMRAYAEAMVLLGLMGGGRSYELPPDERIRGAGAARLLEALRVDPVVEVRPAGTSVLEPTDVRTIVDLSGTHALRSHVPVLALSGLELRGARGASWKIEAAGGDLFVFDSRLEAGEIEVRDRADAWVGGVQVREAVRALSVRDRSRLVVVDSDVSGAEQPWDVDETSRARARAVRGPGRFAAPAAGSDEPRLRLVGVMKQPAPDAWHFLGSSWLFQYANVLHLHGVESARLLDRLCLSTDGEWRLHGRVGNTIALVFKYEAVVMLFLLDVEPGGFGALAGPWELAADADGASVYPHGDGTHAIVMTKQWLRILRLESTAAASTGERATTHVGSVSPPENFRFVDCCSIGTGPVLALTADSRDGSWNATLHAYDVKSGGAEIWRVSLDGIDGVRVATDATGSRAVVVGRNATHTHVRLVSLEDRPAALEDEYSLEGSCDQASSSIGASWLTVARKGSRFVDFVRIGAKEGHRASLEAVGPPKGTEFYGNRLGGQDEDDAFVVYEIEEGP
ncbi:MAG: GTPase [Myxococcales bacterium]|nr:GTPase [Myxococcales bacterium]